MTTNNTNNRWPTPPPGLILAVVRQDQVTACAVVARPDEEWSVLISPAMLARQPRPRTGDLVAVQDGQIVYVWQRALVLRVTPDGVRVRLPGGAQVVAPVAPVAGALAAALRPTEPVFATAEGVIARAWPWYEPEPPSPALQAYAASVVAALGTED
jgi:hypothetical protein